MKTFNIIRVILYVATVALAVALSSCEIPFELDTSPRPELYVQCLPSNEYGHTRLRVQYTRSVSGSADDKRFKEDFHPDSLELRVNGQKIRYSGEMSSQQCDWQCRIVDYAFQPGDRIELYVKGGDAPAVSSSTLMPPVPEIRSIEYSTVSIPNALGNITGSADAETADTNLVTAVKLTLPSVVREGEYYGLQALRGSTVIVRYREKGDTTVRCDTSVYFQYVSAGQLATSADMASLDLDAYAQVNYEDFLVGTTPLDQPMMLLTSRLFDGDSYTFYLGSVDSRNWGEGIQTRASSNPEVEILGNTELIIRYKLYLHRLSDETYRYCKALFLSYFDLLSNFGLTPPNFTYSNISGGLGVLGGISSCESEWFTVYVSPQIGI